MVALTQARSKQQARELTQCGGIEKCYFYNKDKGTEDLLEEGAPVRYEAGDSYYIQCQTTKGTFNGTPETDPHQQQINFMKFFAGKVQLENGVDDPDAELLAGKWNKGPWETYDGALDHFFEDCGMKFITLGAYVYHDVELCDAKIFKFKCGEPPVPAPTYKPVSRPTPCPTKKPVPSPTKKPVPSPTKKPVSSPTRKPTPGRECPHIPEIKECELNDYYLTFKFDENGGRSGSGNGSGDGSGNGSGNGSGDGNKKCKMFENVDIHVKTVKGEKNFTYDSSNGYYDDDADCKVRPAPCDQVKLLSLAGNDSF